MNNRIEDLLSSALEKIKQTIDTSTVVGDPIMIGENLVVPITKITMGVVAGGGEYPSTDKQVKKIGAYPFAGGTGTGVSIQPIGFLCAEKDKIHLLKVDALSPLEKFIENMPKLAISIAEAIKEKKCENNK